MWEVHDELRNGCLLLSQVFFMVALCNSADHYIFVLWFLSIFFFLA